MRVIVPLQGVVQGRGGLVLGSAIPCALFYFLQLYLRRRNRSASTPPPAPEQQLPDLHVLSRSLSRAHLSPRGAGGPAYVSGRASSVAKSGDSPCDVGLRKVSEDPYDEARNPDGVIQLGSLSLSLSLSLFALYRVLSGFVVVIVGLGSRLDGGECEGCDIGWRKKWWGAEYRWDCKLPAS